MTRSIRIIGPDADGLLWIHADAGTLQGAVSVRAASIAGRAFLAVQREARDPEPAPPPDPDERVKRGFRLGVQAAARSLLAMDPGCSLAYAAERVRDLAAPAPAASLTRALRDDLNRWIDKWLSRVPEECIRDIAAIRRLRAPGTPGEDEAATLHAAPAAAASPVATPADSTNSSKDGE